jgi:hypothetical protein
MSAAHLSFQAEELARRGYVAVVVMRRGFGTSQGSWKESSGRCEAADHERAARESARDLRAALQALLARPDVDGSRALRKDKLERFAGARELAEAAISALAIQGTVEELARASQTEIATRLAQRAPRIDPESAAVTVRPPSSPELASEQPHAAGQSARSTAVSSVLPPIPKRGLDGAQLLWVAVAVLVACGVLALILT